MTRLAVSSMEPASPANKTASSKEADLDEQAGGAGWVAQAALVVALLCAASWLLAEVPTPSLRVLLSSHVPIWVPASVILFWRWGWTIIHWIRALLYQLWVYPRLQRRAHLAAVARGDVPELAILLATFKERPEVTRRVITSVLDELDRLTRLRRKPLLIAVTGSPEDDDAIRHAFAAHPRASREPPAELLILRGAQGKRHALGAGLKHLLERGIHPDGAFVMMDGDTRLEPNTLVRTLPFFRLEPKVYALTTNEHAKVRALPWFSEWIHMRHGQRHVYNCSLALSGKLLCLTGRFSVFRGASLDEGFIDIVTNDSVQHWLWGRYQLLSGDDKSTWFYLLSQGRRLLYAPDASVVTYELVEGSCVVRAYHNLRRWGGNMVRNSQRAIALGPGKLGLFCWWCLIDQRISIWTTLIGPTAAIYMLRRDRADLVAAYLLWVLCSRLVRSIPAWLHGRRVSFYYAPVAVLSDWAGALVKLWVMAFPARQFWHNRGGRELDSTRGATRLRDRRIVAGSMLVIKLSLYTVLVGQLIGSLPLRADLARLTRDAQSNPLLSVVMTLAVVVLSAKIALRVRGEQPAGSERDG